MYSDWLSKDSKVSMTKGKSKRFDIVPSQKLLYDKKMEGKRQHQEDTKFRTDLGRSVGITTAIQLVLLKGFEGSRPMFLVSQNIKLTFQLFLSNMFKGIPHVSCFLIKILGKKV